MRMTSADGSSRAAAAVTQLAESRSRWELRHIGLVNWYLFAARDIHVHGRIALVGPNGAGKSSILDAIQTVMTGRSGRHLQLNGLVQTDRSSRRTVRDYCLGAIDDAESGTDTVREQAISYILIGFRHEPSGRECTVGICLAARKDQPDEDVLARFVVEGRMLTTRDVANIGTDTEGEWVDSRKWKDVAVALKADPSVTVTVENGPELFVKSLVRVLGPERGGVIDPQKFLRNLKNSVAFRPVGNTTDFVRNFILDPQPLNLRDLRDSIGRYRAIQAKVAELKARIAEAEDLASRAAQIRTRQRKLLQHRLTLARGRLHLAATALASARDTRDATSRDLEARGNEIPGLEASARDAEVWVAELRSRASGNETARAAVEIEDRRKLSLERAEAIRMGLLPLARLAREAPAAGEAVGDLDRGVADALTKTGGEGPEAARSLISFAGSGRAAHLRGIADKLEKEIEDARSHVAEGESTLAALQDNLARAKSGKRVLGQGPTTLMRLLNEAGIDAVPVCDLVETVDSAWWRVTEAILGEAREALIVPPEEYDEAIRLYRSASIYGAQVVNTTKTKGTRAAKKNSLATAVEVSDLHARAFLDYRLGNIAMVHDEAGLRREESAATPDLMYASGRTTRRLRAPDRLLFGTAHAEEMAEQIRNETQGVRLGLARWRERLDSFRERQRTLGRWIDGLEAIDRSEAERAMAELEAAERQALRLTEDARRLAEGDDGGTAEALAEAEAALAAARRQATLAIERRAGLVERLSSQEAIAKAHERDVDALREEARALVAANSATLEQEEANEALWWIGEPIPEAPSIAPAASDPEAAEATGKPRDDSLEARLDHLEGYLVTYHARRLENDRPNFIIRVGTYVNQHGLDRPVFLGDGQSDAAARFEEASAWVSSEVERLNGLVLKDYEGKAAEAHRDAVMHFKGDFVGKMRGAFEAIHGRLRELNRQLAKRDFHGLTYRFDRKESAAHRDMIALVEAADDPDFELALGGAGPVGLNDRVAKAVRKLEALAMDPEADLGELEDPRRYYEFDIGMDKDGIERTTMSKRLGTGSGGQVQVPFYIAICAALAATYFPDRHGMDGGLALAMFDEAFNRMDQAVIGEVLGFMDDVGLQPFIAAPDKERPVFMQVVDTIIGLSRVGTALTLDVQYVKEEAHRLFREENPHLQGFAAYSERAGGKSLPMQHPENDAGGPGENGGGSARGSAKRRVNVREGALKQRLPAAE